MSERKQLEVLITNGKQADRQEWLALPTDADKVRALFDRLGIEPVPYSQHPRADYYVTAAKNLPFPELGNMITRWNTIDGLNWLASRLDVMEAADLATIRAQMSLWQGYDIASIIKLTYNTEFYVLVPNVHNEADLGRYYLNDSGMVEMPEEWKAGIDPARFGTHIMEQEKGCFTPQGYLVLSGDKWKEVDRTHIPEEYKAEFGKPGPAKEKQSVREALKQAGKVEKDAPGKTTPGHLKPHDPEL